MLYLWKSSIYSKFQHKESCNKQTCVYFVDAAILRHVSFFHDCLGWNLQQTLSHKYNKQQ